MTKQRLNDTELWQCLNEAEQRKLDGSLPIDVRIRSAETFAICLREASNRGYDYSTLKQAAAGCSMNLTPDNLITPHGIRLLFDNRALRRADAEREARRAERTVAVLAFGCVLWAACIAVLA